MRPETRPSGGAHDHGSGAHDHGAPDHAPADGPPGARVPRIGIGGPVGSGKTALVAALCRALSGELVIGVVMVLVVVVIVVLGVRTQTDAPPW